MKTINYHQLSKLTAFASFSIGTILFINHKLSGNLKFVNLGISFILIAIVVNLIVLGALIRQVIINKKERSKLLISVGILLVNIPITLIYLINI